MRRVLCLSAVASASGKAPGVRNGSDSARFVTKAERSASFLGCLASG